MRVMSIVLPTFNERANIENFVTLVLEQGKKLSGYQVEIIIADSNSTDGTVDIVKKLAHKYKNVHYLPVGSGLGVAFHDGHAYAIKHFHPDILMQLDSDGQVDVSIIEGLVHAIEDGYTLALGSRFVKGGKNELSFSRRLFSNGSSLISRWIMGPIDIKEFGNSARAFTPAIFTKINWKRLPWKQKTFIMQPAFLHEAILAGAKYKEVPLIFKDRAAGYSKNKIVSYTIDVVSYAIDARLHSWGLHIPFFQMVQKLK